MKLTIGHFYPDLLNLYGDKGNIMALQKRCEWRDIEVEIKEIFLEDQVDFAQLDLVFIGGGSEREQLMVCNRLREMKAEIAHYIENDGVVLAICGGYQMLGNYYQTADQQVEGLSVLDIYTLFQPSRMIDNVVIETKYGTVVGFENHNGRTYIGNYQPLGKVLHGHGNNGEDGLEGVVYRNVFGTYLHGPLLPKNPALADELIRRSLMHKYGDVELKGMDDTVEQEANAYIVKRFTGADA